MLKNLWKSTGWTACWITVCSLALLSSCGFYTEIIIESKPAEVRNQVRQAMNKMMELQFTMFKFEIAGFHKVHQRYPTTEEGLSVLYQKRKEGSPPDVTVLKDEIPLDPWGKSYRYQWIDSDDVLYTLSSAGPDTTFDTDDDFRRDVKNEKP